MKFPIPVFAMVARALAFAAPAQAYCDALGQAAQSFAVDRISGISYKQQRSRIQTLAAGTSDPQATKQVLEGIARTVYVDMPKLTPDGAYKFVRVACMTAP